MVTGFLQVKSFKQCVCSDWQLCTMIFKVKGALYSEIWITNFSAKEVDRTVTLYRP